MFRKCNKSRRQKSGIKLLGVIMLVSMLIAGFRIYVTSAADIERLQTGIANEIIRFHVRANSDLDSDQQLKLLVKDAVVAYLQPILSASESIDQSRKLLEAHTEDIRKVAADTLLEAGSDEEVFVYFEQSYFPMKTYGDVTFPPGTYEAFRIDIGDHAGKNWWCVLYPPLCFVDAVYGVVPEESKEQLAGVLTEEEYDAVTGEKYQFRFKYLTFLNKLLR
ncbi:MAG: stage II sporulation protein R [Eubacteriales bacterium]|nr:stage II sporulation protein R [Eubacteriales bacterium]